MVLINQLYDQFIYIKSISYIDQIDAVCHKTLVVEKELRQMLCQELEYFGPGTFQQQLDKAYKNFVGFSRANKMDQSQPPFKESKVPW